MPAFQGNTSTNAISTAYNIAKKVTSFSLANKTGGSITVSIGVLYGSTIYWLYNYSLSTAQSYIYAGEPIILEAERQVYISVSGSTDYYVTIDDY